MKNDFITASINEIERLQGIKGAFEELETIINRSLQNGQDEHFVAERHEKLRDLDIAEDFLTSIEPCGLNTSLYQLITIHLLFQQTPALKSQVDLCRLIESLNATPYYQLMKAKSHYLIVYQEHFGNVTWHRYLKTASLKTWSEIEGFRKSIPYCKLFVDDIIDILERSTNNFPRDGAIHALAHALAIKVSTDDALKQQVFARIGEFIANEHVQLFAPRFLQSAIGNNEQTYLEKFEELVNAITEKNSAIILKALELAAPTEILYIDTYLPLLNTQLAVHNITRAKYLDLSLTKQVSVQARHDFALEVAQTLISTDEGHAVLGYLDNFIAYSESTWYQNTAEAVLTYPNEDLVYHLNNFIHEVADKNLPLVFTLMTKRFEAMGSNNFLEDACTYMAADTELFAQYMTQWFLSENTNVHFAMRKLCSLRSIPDRHYQLSKDRLMTISASEKLFIATKIAGYVYLKEPLKNLMISLTNSTLTTEKTLLANLYQLFDQYVVYNYRGILDDLRTLTKQKDLPKHLNKFYKSIINAYEDYFKQLEAIPNLMELSADFIVSRYRDFYEQAMFQNLHSTMEKSDLFSLFKPVAVKSPNWAIRRPGENIHDVQPLGHFETSAEFPMGERLNPIFQEKTRRHYQRLEKHEINID